MRFIHRMTMPHHILWLGILLKAQAICLLTHPSSLTLYLSGLNQSLANVGSAYAPRH
ncbi:Uncharacterised protein [Vibrio cholerae]|nr:Uncharacterised protein [Vibrio cholerae]CSI74612.1 Uncharacterised protein [Vibrio cholerae]